MQNFVNVLSQIIFLYTYSNILIDAINTILILHVQCKILLFCREFSCHFCLLRKYKRNSLNIIALKSADDITCKRNALTGSKSKIKTCLCTIEVHVFILNKFFIENKECVESNRNPGYYTLVARCYLCTIPNHSSFWYRTIIVNEVHCMYLKKK